MSEELPPQPKSADGVLTMQLGSVLPKTAEVKSGRLFIGGVDMAALARDEGTALYVMDEEHIRAALREYRDNMGSCGVDGGVVYAGKAFCSVAMDRIVAEEECCLDASSGGELAIARAAGFPFDGVFFHGNNKTETEISEALDAGVGYFVVDTLEELDRISHQVCARNMRQKILLRVTPGVLADTHSFIQTGAEDSKFGFGAHNGAADEALAKALTLPGIEVEGFHIHIGSQIFALDSFAKAIEVICSFMGEVYRKHGFAARVLDLGGGLGIAYRFGEVPTPIPDFCKFVCEQVVCQCERCGLSLPKVFVEPGRSIVADAGVTLYTVGSVKDIPGVRTYVAVDGGMTDNIRTPLYGAVYEAVIANKADKARDFVCTIVGKHCESGDVVIPNASIQSPDVGDVLCVFSTGAYCQSMASNYNKQVRPGVVMVRGGQARVIVRRETYDDLLSCEVY